MEKLELELLEAVANGVFVPDAELVRRIAQELIVERMTAQASAAGSAMQHERYNF